MKNGTKLVVVRCIALKYIRAMARTKGAKDKTPRKLSEKALANLRHQHKPGFKSVSVRVYAQESAADWFQGLDSEARGRVIQNARTAYVR